MSVANSGRPAHFGSFVHEAVVVLLVCLAQFLCQGSITMSLSTMNIVLESFASQSKAPVQLAEKVWFMGSFALTVGTFILIAGSLGDIFGLKRVFVLGWFWVSFWSLVTGLSHYSKSIIFYIVCRAFQGVGFALLLPCGMGILGNVYASGSNRKNFAFGLVGAFAPSGATLVALMAAVVGQLWWWPWEFWLMSIFTFLLGCLAVVYVPEITQEEREDAVLALETPCVSNWCSFDFVGASLGVSSLILFNFVWNQGPIVGWNTAYIIVLLVVSVLLMVTFFYYEFNWAKRPLLPRSILNYKIGLVLLAVSLGWGSFGVWQYFYWNTILNLRHYTAVEGGSTYIPFFVVGIIAAMSVSVIISRTRPSYIIFFASIAFMCGMIMLSVTPIDQTYFRMSLGQMLILGWGMDLSFPAASLILSDFLPRADQGMAASLVSTVINYSVSFFLGVSSTVEIEVFNKTNDVLKSYRAAEYFGIGVGALAVLVSIVFITTQHVTNDKIGTFDEYASSGSESPEIEKVTPEDDKKTTPDTV